MSSTKRRSPTSLERIPPQRRCRACASCVLRAGPSRLQSGSTVCSPSSSGIHARGRSSQPRDPLGHHPLFYAMGKGRSLVLLDSIVALARADGVSTAINRPVLAASLINYHLDAAETYFEAIRRVPAGRALTTGPSGATSERDRDPAPTEQAVEWITEADIPHFSTVLERALGRALSVGRPSIFLSGGIDSVALATLRLRHRARTSTEPPIALSLVFPDPNFNEERVQRLVAGELGMPQTVIPFRGCRRTRRTCPRGFAHHELMADAACEHLASALYEARALRASTRAPGRC